MSKLVIDINCDLGEGTGNDAAIMPYLSSANIACGFHAGNAVTMLDMVQLARKHQVAIGAHPSFHDPDHFGRRTMHIPANEIYAIVVYQLGALAAICRTENTRMRHVKPHGALYNQAAADRQVAGAIIAAIKDTDPSLILYGLSGSPFLSQAAAAGLSVVHEVFADRTYNPDGSLTARSMPHAVITDTNSILRQVLGFIQTETVQATDHSILTLRADTICLHGDGLHATDFAKAIHQFLQQNQVRIQAPHEN